MPFDVFISHSLLDKTVADAVCARLEEANVRCWIAPRDISPGADWAESIIEALAHCRSMVLIFSSNSNASPQVKREVQAAFEQGLTVIPFRIEDVQPAPGLKYYIGPVHWLDAISEPLEQHIARLVPLVRTFLGATGGIEPAPPSPPLAAPAYAPPATAAAPAPRKKTAQEMNKSQLATVIALALVTACAVVAAVVHFAGSPRKKASPIAPQEPIAQQASTSQQTSTAQQAPVAQQTPTAPKSQTAPSPSASRTPVAQQTPTPKPGPTAEEIYDEAVRAFSISIDGGMIDQRKAGELMQKAVDKGLPEAESFLGMMYFTGYGVTMDQPKGTELMKQALADGLEARAKSGNSRAEKEMASEYLYAVAMPQDYTKAASLLESAMAHGNTDAAPFLAAIYAQGYGDVKRDAGKAVELLMKADSLGNALADSELGGVYANGEGVEADYAKALEYYKKSAAAGFSEGQVGLAKLYENGSGVEKDIPHARELYAKAAAQENMQAKTALLRLDATPPDASP